MASLRKNLPPLDGLRGFLAVARNLSFTGAATDLFLTQSAVSRQVQALERHLGVSLFDRGRRGVTLTPAGRELLDVVTPWVERLSAFRDRHENAPRNEHVSITSSAGVVSLWLIPRLADFNRRHPDIEVRVVASNKVLNLAVEGVDAAIRYCRPNDAPRDAVRLFNDEIVPVASPQLATHAFANKHALLDVHLLEYDDITRPWAKWGEWLHTAGMSDVSPHGIVHFNRYDHLIEAAVRGIGVALGRIPLISHLIQEGRLLAATSWPAAKSDYGFWLTAVSTQGRPAVAALMNWLRDQAK